VPPQENFSKILTQIGPAGKTNRLAKPRGPGTDLLGILQKKRLQELRNRAILLVSDKTGSDSKTCLR
jgi:hypothetical protein